MERSFQYSSNIQEIPRIRKDLEFLKSEWSIPDSDNKQILLIIEEIFSNIVRYAFADKKEHHVHIRLEFRDNQIEINIIDDGIPFNPLDYELDVQADPATSDAGGMGLTLIRAFSSDLVYQRHAGRNHLKISKKVRSK